MQNAECKMENRRATLQGCEAHWLSLRRISKAKALPYVSFLNSNFCNFQFALFFCFASQRLCFFFVDREVVI